MTAWPDSGVDVLLGVGGTPEGVLVACALRAMGGEIQGKLYARDEEELRRGREAGYDFDKILTMEDLVSSEDVFFAATGITDGELLQGVRYFGDGASTDSLVVRGLTGTVRQITATHRLDKLHRLTRNETLMVCSRGLEPETFLTHPLHRALIPVAFLASSIGRAAGR